MLTYDSWGGWYDHVPPPVVDRYGYGFRVPALLVSPYAKRGTIDHATLDFTSILRFIEDNWRLAPLASATRMPAASLRPSTSRHRPAARRIRLDDRTLPPPRRRAHASSTGSTAAPSCSRCALIAAALVSARDA